MDQRGKRGDARRWRLPPRIPTFVGVLLVLGLLSWLRPAGNSPYLPGRSGPLILAVLIALFAAAEIFPVHLHFDGNTHSFSLFEIPLALGLFFVSGPHLIIVRILGGGAALRFHRKQPATKLLFNVACFMLEDRLAVSLFRFVGGQHGNFTIMSIVGAAAGALAASMLSTALVTTVICLAENKRPDRHVVASLGFGGVSALVTISVGLVAVAVVAAYPEAAWLLVIPTIGLQGANHAYAKERRRHRGLVFLHDATKSLHQSAELGPALHRLVGRARDEFSAAHVELAYLASGSEVVMHVSARVGETSTEMVPRDQSSLAPLMAEVSDATTPLVILSATANPMLATVLAERHLNDAIVAPLRADGRACGLLLIGHRPSDIARFDRDDAVLLETLAENVAAALENGRLEQLLDQLRRMEQRLTHQTNHDELTGLANRTMFARIVTDALSQPHAESTAVLFVDLDDFKTVNDSLGHAAGDELLVALGRRLGSALPTGATAARLGGDEFAVVLPGVRGLAEVTAIAEQLLATIGAPVSTAGRVVPVHASIGAALSMPGQVTADLLRNADTAMYAAKNLGKDRVAVFEPALHDAAVQRYNLTFDLHRAVKEHEFVTFYQPIIDLASGEIVAAEALIRWQHPTLGLLAPGEFISIAEESDIILHVGRSVLHDVGRMLNQRPRLGRTDAPVHIAVNLSARNLFSDDLFSDVVSTLSDYQIDPSHLVFEITEGTMITDPDEAAVRLLALKQLGARIALDDFGTGYSSLSQLGRLPVDIIKIAQPFIDDMETTGQPIVEAIILMSQSLGLTIVAEGIEHASQAAKLRTLGCHLGQGYHFGRPMPEEQFLDALQPETIGSQAKTTGATSRT
jgi:diguanylate cyclase (GGDEF)-like protein